MQIIDLTNRAIKGANYNWRNFTPAKVAWSLLVRDKDEAAPYTCKDEVRVAWKDVTVLIGTIRRCDLEMSGNAWRWNIEAADILQPLEGVLCFGDDGRLRGSVGAEFGVAGGSGGEAAPRRVRIAATLKSLLESALKCGALPAGTGISIDVPDDAWMWDTAMGCDMYAGVLRKILGNRPGMAMWVDYSATAPVIHIADGSGLPVTSIDRVRDRLDGIGLNPRPDLAPPAVGVVLTAGRAVCATQAWPPGADLRREGCVTIQMAVGGSGATQDDAPAGSEDTVWDFTRPVVEVRGAALPEGNTEAARKWWLGKLPDLADCRDFVLGPVKKTLAGDVDNTSMTNYSTAESAQRYEHISGQLSEACKTIKWSYVVLRQLVYTFATPPKSLAGVFTQSRPEGGRTRYWGYLPWRGRTINTNRRKYRASKLGDSGADGGGEPPGNGNAPPHPPGTDIPDYTSALRDYYDITRATPCEGSVRSLRALAPASLAGRRLAITGSRREYMDMAAVVQGVTLDMDGETTSIDLGVPAHLSLQDMIDRVARMAGAQQTLDHDALEQGPMQDLVYDDEAHKSPPAPTIGPEGQVVLTTAPDAPPGYGFETRLNWSDDNTAVTGYRLRPGKLMLQGGYVSKAAPAANSGEWYEEVGFAAGEVWLDVHFNNRAELTRVAIAHAQGVVNPIRLALDPLPPDIYSYSFHIATLRADRTVIQHILGTIQIPVAGGTFYPYGPSV